MRAPDEANERTEALLAQLERRIARLYQEALGELNADIAAYFERFRERDEEMKALIGTVLNGREWTEQDYLQWRLNQIGRGRRFEDLRDRIAERMTQANETAIAYVNDETPSIYSLNRNYAAYAIERATGDVGFTLWDESTVRRLITKEPDLMPYYPEERAVRRGIDLQWGKRQITKAVTSGILQGRSVGKIASALQRDIPQMNRVSAVRAARTAVTGAQNAGRMDSYAAAERMGIGLQKEWLATLDGRTRHAHAMLDGQRAQVDQPFLVDGRKIRFPGDPAAAGDLVYNCRCTLIASVEGVDTGDAQRRARDPKTGESVLIENMTYQEWAEWKERTNTAAVSSKPAIIEHENAGGKGGAVQTVGKIDIKKYSMVASQPIRTKTVVLTDNQREHIIKRRGQEFFDQYSAYFQEIAENPDYIFKDNSHENTAIACKTITEVKKNVHLVIRLAVVRDKPGLENSIITAIIEGDKRYRQRLRNNIPLYKKE